jgi:hypothetical protein
MEVAWCAQGQAWVSWQHGDGWLALAHRRLSKTYQKNIYRGKQAASTQESPLIMTNRGGVLCLSLKIHLKKLAAEPNTEPIPTKPN